MIVPMSIVLDGKVICDDLESGTTRAYNISPGKHTLLLEMSALQTRVRRAGSPGGYAFVSEKPIGYKRFYSNTVEFEIRMGETLSFECGTPTVFYFPLDLIETALEILTFRLLTDRQSIWLSRV